MPACDPERSVTKFGRKSATRPLADMEIGVDHLCGCLLFEANRVALGGGTAFVRMVRAQRCLQSRPKKRLQAINIHGLINEGTSSQMIGQHARERRE